MLLDSPLCLNRSTVITTIIADVTAFLLVFDFINYFPDFSYCRPKPVMLPVKKL